MIYKVTMIYHGNGGIQHTADHQRWFLGELMSKAKNISEVKDLAIANHIVFDLDNRRIVQAAGYDAERGLFCDLY